jgi:hypothetical protein
MSARETGLSTHLTLSCGKLIALAYNPKFFDGSGNPGIDQYEQELILATEIRGYWQVAYKHIIDNLPRRQDWYRQDRRFSRVCDISGRGTRDCQAERRALSE